MQNVLTLMPMCFFLLIIFFRLKENSVALFEKYELQPTKKIVWEVPISDLKKQIELTSDERIKEDLQKCLRNRRYTLLSIFLCFLSVFIAGFFNSVVYN